MVLSRVAAQRRANRAREKSLDETVNCDVCARVYVCVRVNMNGCGLNSKYFSSHSTQKPLLRT